MSREVFLVIHPRDGDAPEERRIAELSSLIPEIRRYCNIAEGQAIRVVKGKSPRKNAPGLPTKREVDILAYIQAHIDRNGCSPSFSEIAMGIDIGCVNITYISRACKRLGSLGVLAFSVLPSGRLVVRSLRLTDAGGALIAERVEQGSAW